MNRDATDKRSQVLSTISEPITFNKFFKFVKSYYYFIRQVKFELDKPERVVTSTWIWSKNKKFEIPSYLQDQLRSIVFDYNNRVGYFQICNINYDMDQWLTMVREFILFLDYMEICSLYKNDKGDSNLYVEADLKNSTYNMYYYDDNKDTEYRISFLDTEIPKSGKQSAIMNFIDGIDTDDNGKENAITLVQIDILRRYGDKRTTQLKLVPDANTNRQFLQREEDGITFNVFRDILSQIIFNTFNDILNNVNKIVGFERNITEEVLHGYIKLSDN